MEMVQAQRRKKKPSQKCFRKGTWISHFIQVDTEMIQAQEPNKQTEVVLTYPL